MIAYGIFDGVARRDHLVVAVVLRPEDYQQIYGGSIDDYLDYLLGLEDALNGIEDPVRVVRVPFDVEMYRAWLEGSSWRDGPEARSAWALAVADDPGHLAELRKRHPVLPAAPEHERMTVEIFYLALPMICEDEEDVDRLSRQLNPAEAAELCERLRGEMPPVPACEKISRLRARGADLLVGDRLVGPAQVEELDGYLRRAVLTEGTEGVARVPRRFRLRKGEVHEQVGSLPALVPAFLPLVLTGAREDVGFLGEWLAVSQQEFLARAGSYVEDLLFSAGWEEDMVGRPGPLLEAWEVPDFLEVINSELGPDDEDGGDVHTAGGPGTGRAASKGRGLRRVK